MPQVGQEELVNLLKDKSWFHSIGEDEFGRHVVYAKYLCPEAYHSVPDYAGGKQVLLHLSQYLEASREKFCASDKKPVAPIISAEPEVNLDKMIGAIFVLKRKCGIDNLIDILYEIHEKFNGVAQGNYLTEVSMEFPEVRVELEAMYDEYGFDVLFNEIEN